MLKQISINLARSRLKDATRNYLQVVCVPICNFQDQKEQINEI